MSKLPKGWVWTTLGEVCDVVGGATPKTSNPSYWGGSIPWVTPDDLSRHDRRGISCGARSLTDEGLRAASVRILPAGTVLFSSRAPIGYVAIAEVPLGTNQGFKSVVPPRGLLSDFLYWYLRFATPLIESMASGTTFKEISKRRMQEVPLPLPPRAEQERIVAAIEEHLSRLDAAEVCVNAVLRRTDALVQRLIDSSWDRGEEVTLGDLLEEPLANGRSVRTDPDGFPVLRLTALRNRRVDLSERKGGAWSGDEARPFLIREGDFLVSRGNGSLNLVGRGGLVDEVPDPVAYPDTLIRVRVQPSRYDVRFLSLVWDSTHVRRQIEGQARTTAGIYKVNQEMLRRINLPLLPLHEQAAIVGRFDAAMSACERVKAEAHRSQVRLSSLRRSILAAAFSGQLVPQDPDDEPASVLLERIRAERAAAGSVKRTRKAKAS